MFSKMTMLLGYVRVIVLRWFFACMLAFGLSASAAQAETFSIGEMLQPGGVDIGLGITATATSITAGDAILGTGHGQTGIDSPFGMGGAFTGQVFNPAFPSGPVNEATRLHVEPASSFDNGDTLAYKDAIGFHINFSSGVPADYFYGVDLDGTEWKTSFAFNGNTLVVPTFEFSVDTELSAQAATVDNTVWQAASGLDASQVIPATVTLARIASTSGGAILPDYGPRQVLFNYNSATVTDIIFLFGESTRRGANGAQNSGITALSLDLPELNTTKAATGVETLADGTYDITYEITVENSGAWELDTLTLTDGLSADGQLGSAWNGITTGVAFTTLPTDSGSVAPTLNTGFNGDTDIDLIVPNGGGLLQPGDSYAISFTVNVDPEADGAPDTYDNLAMSTGNAPAFNGFTVSDGSDPVDDAEPSSEGEPLTLTPPTADDDDSLGNTAGATVEIVILNGDDDPDGDIEAGTVSLVVPTDGSVTEDPVTDADGDVVSFVVDGEGTWSVDDEGLLTFEPADGYAGDPTPIEYTVEDNTGFASSPATVTVSYTLTPFTCDSNFYEVISGQLSVLDPANGNYTPIGDALDPTYNSTAYSTEDNFIYGIDAQGADADRRLIRIGAGGFYEPVFTIGIRSNDGTADTSGNYYFNATGSSVDVVDISTETLSTISFSPSHSVNNVADIAYVNVGGAELLVGGSGGNLLIWNLTTGVSSAVSADGLTTGAYGAAWATSDGRVYLSNNNTGTIYVVDDILGDPTVVYEFAAAVSSQHDGMNCYFSEPPFSVPPIAVADEDLGNEGGTDVTLNITDNDDDGSVDVDPSTVSLIAPDDATDIQTVDGDIVGFTVDGEGTWSVDEDGNLTFAPEDGYLGDPTVIEYTITNPTSGLTSDPATVTITYDTLPVAEDDESLNNTSGEPVTLDIVGNDDDPDGDIDPATVSLIVPDGVTLVGAPTTDDDGDIVGFVVDGEGEWAVDEDGVLTFTPEDGYVGDPTPITYTVEDDEGFESNPATVTIGYGEAPEPEIELIQSIAEVLDTNGNGIFGDAGDTVVYEYTVSNPGETALSDVTIIDPGFDTDDEGNSFTPEDGFDGTLAIGEGTDGDDPILVGTGLYVITDDDVEAGEISTTAEVESTAVATDDAGEPNVDAPLFDNDGPLDAVVDLSDTGTEPELDRTDGTVTTIDDPANTPSGDDPDNPGDDPTVLLLQSPLFGEFVLTKSTASERVLIGEVVSYEIVATSLVDGDFSPAQVIDTLPDGMAFVPGSATVDGEAATPVVSGQTITFDDLTIPGDGSVTIVLQARVVPGAPAGDLTNVAGLVDALTGDVLAAEASATVVRMAESVFDCSNIIGKVFDDVNMDGYQDVIPDPSIGLTSPEIFDGKLGGKLAGAAVEQTEVGIPNVRLVTPSGTVITTDAFGRYSVPCAELPAGIGSNFMLKLDTRTLPSGYRVTTENPRVMRVTPGMMTEMNFGAALGSVFDVDLSARAYAAGEVAPSQALVTGLEAVLQQIADTPTVIRIAYYRGQEDADLARDRLDAIEDIIQEKWADIGDYRLLIEKSVNQLQ